MLRKLACTVIAMSWVAQGYATDVPETTLLPRVLEKAGQLDIFHANAGTYVGGDLVDADTSAIDRMLNLNVNVVMKNGA